jgi:MFS family permease
VSALVQAGYASGILFISPTGDLVRRRQLLMLLMLLGAVFSIGCALATSVEMLVGFSFIVGAVTVSAGWGEIAQIGRWLKEVEAQSWRRDDQSLCAAVC